MAGDLRLKIPGERKQGCGDGLVQCCGKEHVPQPWCTTSLHAACLLWYRLWMVIFLNRDVGIL